MESRNVYKSHFKNKDVDRLSLIASVHPEGFRVMPLEIRNASPAFRMPSLLELMSSRGMGKLINLTLFKGFFDHQICR